MLIHVKRQSNLIRVSCFVVFPQFVKYNVVASPSPNISAPGYGGCERLEKANSSISRTLVLGAMGSQTRDLRWENIQALDYQDSDKLRSIFSGLAKLFPSSKGHELHMNKDFTFINEKATPHTLIKLFKVLERDFL